MTNEEIADKLLDTVKVDLDDGTWTPNEPLEFDFPYDGALFNGGFPDTLKAQQAATDLIEKAFRNNSWYPVNLPWDDDNEAIIEPIQDELQGHHVTVNFTVTGDEKVIMVSRDWLLFVDDWKETAYRAVM